MNADADQVRIDDAITALNVASSKFEGALLDFASDCIQQYLKGATDETEFWVRLQREHERRKLYWLGWQLENPRSMDIVCATYQREFALLRSLLQIHEYRYYDRYFDDYYPDEWLEDIENAPEEITEYTLTELLLQAVEKYMAE